MPDSVDKYISYFNIKLDGEQANRALMDDLLDITIENSLQLPDMCTLRFHDLNFKWIDDPSLNPGADIEVSGGYEESALTTLFQGEIAGIELDISAVGAPTVVIRCFDRAHRLHRGRYSRTFVQSMDSDIVQKVGSEQGFKVTADNTGQVHDWVLQNNQTNWEFLSERASHNGCRLYVKNKTELRFEKVSNTASDTVTLKWGETLRSFRPRVSTSHQVDEVMVRGWDPMVKQGIIASATTPKGLPEIGDGMTVRNAALSKFGNATMYLVDRPVHSVAEAESIAQSLCDEIGGDYLTAEGLCDGEPRLMAGVTIEVDNIGERFKGKYLVTSTTHLYTPSEGYTTVFSVSGKTTNTVLGMLEGQKLRNRAPVGGNIVIGVVTDNVDPDNMGRIKVMYPWLTDEHTSYWARCVAPMAGKGRGFYFLPEVGDEVLVAFEHGDVRRPYILGALWNGNDNTIEGNDTAVSGGQVVHRTIKSRIGHTITLDDTDGQAKVNVTTAGNNSMTLDDGNKNITLKTDGGHQIIMDDEGQKIQIVDSSQNLWVTLSTSGDYIKIMSVGDIQIQATGNITINGEMGVSIESGGPMVVSATANMGISAAGIEMTGDSTVEVTSPSIMIGP